MDAAINRELAIMLEGKSVEYLKGYRDALQDMVTNMSADLGLTAEAADLLSEFIEQTPEGLREY